MNYCNQCGSQLEDDYCERCNLYFVMVEDKINSSLSVQEHSENENIFEKKRKIKKLENFSISIIIVGILLASFGSVFILDIKISMWVTGAILVAAGIFSLFNSYSRVAEAELQIRTIEAQRNLRARKSDTYSMGSLFEAYVASLFPEGTFTFLEVTPRRHDLNGRWIESLLNPDFRLRCGPNGPKIWVECKYRSKFYNGILHWCGDMQLERYRKFQKEHRSEKVYVIIGVGGNPESPESLFCMPLDDIPSATLSSNFYKRYHIVPLSCTFEHKSGRLIWHSQENIDLKKVEAEA